MKTTNLNDLLLNILRIHDFSRQQINSIMLKAWIPIKMEFYCFAAKARKKSFLWDKKRWLPLINCIQGSPKRNDIQ